MSRLRSGWRFEAGLFQDAVQRAWRQVVVAATGNRDKSRFGWMLELVVAAARSGEQPTVVFEPAPRVANFHTGEFTSRTWNRAPCHCRSWRFSLRRASPSDPGRSGTALLPEPLPGRRESGPRCLPRTVGSIEMQKPPLGGFAPSSRRTWGGTKVQRYFTPPHDAIGRVDWPSTTSDSSPGQSP